MILERGIIPRSALFDRLNPAIDADFLNVKVPSTCIPWPGNGIRRISINSFGFGGTNSHAILDDAFHYLQNHKLPGFCEGNSVLTETNGNHLPNGHNLTGDALDGTRPRQPLTLLVWSAANAKALDRLVTLYKTYMDNPAFMDWKKLQKLAYTLSERRTVMSWRCYSIVEPASTVKLQPSPAQRALNDPEGMAFVFTGQGAEYATMGAELMRYDAFKDSLDESCAILAQLVCSWSIFGKSPSNGSIVSFPPNNTLILGFDRQDGE